MAGNPAACDAAKVAATRLLTVMSTGDKIMSVETVENFISQIVEAGGEVRFETEVGLTHEETCTRSYTSARLDWIFSAESCGVEHTEVTTRQGRSVCYTTSGHRVENPTQRGVYLLTEYFGNGNSRTRKIIIR